MELFEGFFLVYFGYISFYNLSLAICSFFYEEKSSKSATFRRFAVLIPAYKEDSVIIAAVKSILNIKYDNKLWDIVVIADSLKESTLEKLKLTGVKVIEIGFEKSTKVKALQAAVNTLNDDYDYSVILDADNVVEHDFLLKLNNLVNSGHEVVQARRVPKNKNSELAVLDGISEEVANTIIRKGTVSLGCSASIAGSGLMINYALFKKTILTMNSVGGFDREMELLFLDQGFKVYYSNSIRVFDEKVADLGNFQNQRKRWISSHFVYLKKYFFKAIAKLTSGNFVYFNSALLRNIQLPRLINLGLFTIIIPLTIVFPSLIVAKEVWLITYGGYIMSIVVAIPKEYWNKELIKSIILLPVIFFNMLLILFKIKNSNKEFIHTAHNVSSTEK